MTRMRVRDDLDRLNTRGVVCGGHPDVAEAGAEVLERGGNAVDAAVAAFFTAFHAEPMLASVGGGGFLVAEIDGEPIAYDFFAAAPGLDDEKPDGPSRPWRPSRKDAFYAVEVDFGAARQEFHIGPGSVAVPGALKGLCQIQRDAGALSLGEVLEPAIRACEGGTLLSNMGAFVLQLLEPIVRSRPEFERFLTDDGGNLLSAGALVDNPELADFYARLGDCGHEDLIHDGALTDLLLATVADAGGGLTRTDLKRYAVGRAEPIDIELEGGYELLLAPPPSSGGMLVGYGIRLIEGAPDVGHGSRDHVLLMRAVMAETLRARAEIVGAATPTLEHAERLLDPSYLEHGHERLARLLELGPAALPKIPREESNPAGNTTHVSAIDDAGNACSITISNGECSGLVLPGCGVFLNNFLGEEDLNTGGFHRYPPGARLGSTMTPALLRGPDGSISALGSGGSNRIRTALLQVVDGLVHHDMSLNNAVVADRVHYERGVLYGEAADTLDVTLSGLEQEGMRTSQFDRHNMFFGGVHVARRRADGRHDGMGDSRRSGALRIVHRHDRKDESSTPGE